MTLHNESHVETKVIKCERIFCIIYIFLNSWHYSIMFFRILAVKKHSRITWNWFVHCEFVRVYF